MWWDKGGLEQRRRLSKGRNCLNWVSRYQSGAAWDFSRAFQGHMGAGGPEVPGIPGPFLGVLTHGAGIYSWRVEGRGTDLGSSLPRDHFPILGVQCLRALVFLLSLHSSLQLLVPPKERSPLQRGGKGLFSSSCTFPRRTDGLQVPPLSPAVIPGATS